MRIIGIDPGIAITGYCVLDVQTDSIEDEYSIVTTGSIQTNKNLPNCERLVEIHNDINYLVKKYKPDMASIEDIFFFKNAKTIVPVCEARGVILMSLRLNGVDISEYTPLVVKQVITGYGRADKDDVKQMIQVIFSEQELPKLDDTIDAIAIAVCHAKQYDCRLIPQEA